MAGDESSDSWDQLKALLQQAAEERDRRGEQFRQELGRDPLAPPEPPTAPAGLLPLAQVVDLVGSPHGPALAQWLEERIRGGHLVVYGIQTTAPNLLEPLPDYQAVPHEAWAELLVEWWNGSAVPAEHSGLTAAVAPAWRHLHIASAALVAPENLDLAGGDDLLLTIGTAVILAIHHRQRAVVPAGWRQRRPVWEYPDLPDPATIATELRDAIRDGQLPVQTPDGEPVDESLWLAECGDQGAGRINTGPWIEPAWTAVCVRWGELRRWLEPAAALAGDPLPVGTRQPPGEAPPSSGEDKEQQPAAVAPPPRGGGKEQHQRGRKAADEWWKAVAALGAWLVENGVPDRQADAEEYLKSWVEGHGLSCADSLVRRRAKLAIEAYREVTNSNKGH